MSIQHGSLDALFIDIADVVKHSAGGANEGVIADEFPAKILNIPSNGYDVRVKKMIERTISTMTPYSLNGSFMNIGASAFSNCTNLALTSLSYLIMSIGNNAFHNCTKLKSLTFEGTPKTIASSAFSGCNNLTTINVPWAEGEVANAPWGATNATINYNYTGG